MSSTDKGSNAEDDCLPCRLVGGLGMLGASTYVFSHLKRQTQPVPQIAIFSFGAALGYIGIARLSHLPPFDVYPRSDQRRK